MKIKERWVSWEELLSGFTPAFNISFSQVGGMTVGSIPFADSSGYLTEDNANFFWDEANFRLGLGTSGPECRAHIRESVCGDYAGLHPWTGLLIEGTTNIALQMQTATNGTAFICFASDTFNPPAGRIAYSHTDSEMNFTMGSSVRVFFGTAKARFHMGELELDSTGVASVISNSHNADAYFALEEDEALKWTMGFDYDDGQKFQISQGIPGTNVRFEIDAGTLINLYLDVGIRDSQDLRFYTNGNYIAFKPPALGGDTTWVLPDSDGGAGEAIITDGASNLSFASVADEKVAVDNAAVAGYLGAASNDGVLRTGTSLSYVDGVDFVTLNTIQDIRTSASPTFAGLTITDIFSEDHAVDHNLFLGHLAGTGIQAGGQYNIFIGESAGAACTTADYSIIIGYQAGDAGTTALAKSVIIGHQAGTATTNDRNIFIGYWAGRLNTTGNMSVVIGTQAFEFGNSAGTVAIGTNALRQATGGRNIGIGYQAGTQIGVGERNIIIGYSAGFSMVGSVRNVIIGSSGAYFNTGSYNVALGEEACGGAAPGGAASYNMAIGYACLRQIRTGNYNIAIGNQTLTQLQSVNNNVAIGHQAGFSLISGAGNLLLGHKAGFNELGSNKLYLANSDTETPLVYGEFPNALLKIQATNFNVIGTSNLGDGGVTNYTSIATDGTVTLVGTARVTKRIFLNNAAFTKGATAPVQVILGNLNGWEFDINDDAVMTIMMPDDWDSTTDITIKVCWYIDEAYAADKEIQWRVDWSALPHDFTETVDAPTHSGQIDSGDIDIPAVAKRMGASTIGTIVAANLSAGDMLGFTLSRIAVTHDDPTAKPTIHHLIIEYTSNKIGT